MDQQAVIGATRRWVFSMVIGLNLCPFARRVFAADKISYVVSDAADEGELLNDLAAEVKALASSPVSVVETTLLIHPRVLGDFLDYNDFLSAGERLIEQLGQRGDAVQPIADGMNDTEGTRPLDQNEKCRLKRIVGVVRIVQHAPADAKDHRPMPAHHLGKCCFIVSRSEARKHLIVGRLVRTTPSDETAKIVQHGGGGTVGHRV